MGLPVAFSPCETFLQKKQVETLRLHLPACSRTAAPAPRCPPAFGSGFNSCSSCNWFPAAKPGQAKIARGRNRKAQILLPKHGNGHLPGTESREERSLGGTELPAETAEESQLLILPRRRDGAHSARFHHMQGADGTSRGNHRTPPHGQLRLEALFTPGTRQHPPPAVTQVAAPPSAQPTQKPPDSPSSQLTLASPNWGTGLLLVGAEPSPRSSPTYASAVKQANAKLNLKKGNHK